MTHTLHLASLTATLLVAAFAPVLTAQTSDWKHTGTFWILTTPEGADLPAAASENDFPVLVRLHKDFFPFEQASKDGADLRFATAAGTPLAYQIEEWDPANGHASVWVRVPTIRGNARQELRMMWGNPKATSESSGKAVFNESNGYVSVWHMGDVVVDELGTLVSKDQDTSVVRGMIGKGRHLAGKQGIFGGDKIPNYPSGGDAHSTEAWFRAERSNGTIIGWGNEGTGRGCKVCIQLRSPPHLHVDSDFSDVDAPARVSLGEWTHVVHTYNKGEGRIYVNGRLEGSAKPTMNIKNPGRLWIGGWYGNYNFIGAIDEVRVSRAARSADWVRLQYENQKPQQSLVGPIVQSGSEFAVTPVKATILEGKSATFTAQAGGAQKVYWTLEKDGQETVVGVNRFSYTLDAGRVVGEKTAILRFKAIYGDQVKTREIPITIQEDIPEPMFTLSAPATWDGRETIEIRPIFTNREAMEAKGAGKLNYSWTVSDIAVGKRTESGKLILKRAQNSGSMTISVAIDNGGVPRTGTVTIEVKEPREDAWRPRTPAASEKPEDNQFFPRDDTSEGTLFCKGTLDEPADTAFLKVYAGDRLERHDVQKVAEDKSYSFAVKLKAGLIKYRIEFGSKTGDREKVIHTASNLVCGDAYLIDGQSNADATDVGKDDPVFTSEWIRSYGSMAGDPKNARLKRWGNAVVRDRQGAKLQIGFWGMELAKRLVESQKMPICIINGAVGGSRIDQHQRNPADDEDVTTIYGRLLWRVRQAGLTHGIRGVLWHQGENDQGADGPSGRFGWETYRHDFIEMAAAWQEDYPNLQRYYIFQIWPRACAMGINGSDNMLREVQRTLPRYYSRMSIMSTLGIQPPGGCHFPPAGYAEFARLMSPLVERHQYGKVFPAAISPPDIKSAAFTNARRDEIALEFDQTVVWDNSLMSQFTLDGEAGKIESGSVAGNRVVLKLRSPTNARTITYLDSKSWSDKNLLRGENGIAALTFCNVPVLAAQPPR